MNEDELNAIKAQWAHEQAELQKRAIFEDSNLSFHVTSSKPSVYPDIPSISDYDEPTVYNESPEDIAISGLKYVGGLDISFVPQGHDNTPSASSAGHNTSGETPSATPLETRPDAYAVITVLDYPALTLVHSITLPIRLAVPYIPSFLSYRETPAYLELISSLRKELQKTGKEHEFPQVLLVDGNGRLHVRQAGVATAVGVHADIPTIGVAKTYQPPNARSFNAEADDAEPESHWRMSQKGMRHKSREILNRPGDYLGILSAQKDGYVGAALRSPTASNVLFVSAGHRVSLMTAMRLTMALSKYRIPEPIRLADKMGREAAAVVKE
ncbi:hypothetical protein BDV93DRAFT_485390 [Ceratobasidium sp. AG-I]|nr:hypothetical protein BDV93DRAFT_485390 [Ceratobasidium sp. AG-I]